MSIPPQVLEALQSNSNRPRRPNHSLSSFPAGIQEVATLEQADSQSTNKFQLLCPRSSCSSLILRKSAASLITKESLLLEPQSDSSQSSLLEALPEPGIQTQWWLITPSPMEFENIAFSNPATGLPPLPSGKPLKLLACAECDLGPLGFCEPGGHEFWLACSRVGYAATEEARE